MVKYQNTLVWCSFVFCSFFLHSTNIQKENLLDTEEVINVCDRCGNKIPTRCNCEFLLQILLLAQHVSGTIMPIIRSSRVLYKWFLPVVFGAWFSSCRCNVELRVVCPVCGLQLPVVFGAWFSSCRSVELRVVCPVCGLQLYKHQIRQAETTCIILSSSWWWA
jgi:hypothetical protein